MRFVTEYAGSSAVVARSGVYDSRWDPSRFPSLAPDAAMKELQTQGLAPVQRRKLYVQ